MGIVATLFAGLLETMGGRVRSQSPSSWRSEQENLKPNDLVLLKEDNLPVLKWKIGRILEVHEGKDKLVRIVTMRTASGNTKRAVSKLCKLPLNNQADA